MVSLWCVGEGKKCGVNTCHHRFTNSYLNPWPKKNTEVYQSKILPPTTSCVSLISHGLHAFLLVQAMPHLPGNIFVFFLSLITQNTDYTNSSHKHGSAIVNYSNRGLIIIYSHSTGMWGIGTASQWCGKELSVWCPQQPQVGERDSATSFLWCPPSPCWLASLNFWLNFWWDVDVSFESSCPYHGL